MSRLSSSGSTRRQAPRNSALRVSSGGRPPWRSRGEAAADRHHGTSIRTVTGPSLTNSLTSMCAPNTPRCASSRCRPARTAAPRCLGPGGVDVRRAVALARVAVERELGDAQHLALAQRLVHAAFGVGEDAQIADLLASRSASAVVSEWVTPCSTSRPAALAPVTSSATVTLARFTRWTSATQLAQLGGGLLGGTMQTCAARRRKPKPGQVRQPRLDLDPPAVVLGTAAGRPHPQVQRRARAQPGLQARERVVQQGGAARARVLEAGACAARREHEVKRHERGVGVISTASSSIATIRSRRRYLSCT